MPRVYLSFGGKDARMGFAWDLYDALTRHGIDTFMDDETHEDGELLGAIEASTYAIVVLSSGYAAARWCLDELAHIDHCRERIGLTVIPVFYHVHPSDVCYQRNTFEKDFAGHEARFMPEKVETWRAALRNLSSEIRDFHLVGTRYESEVIFQILSCILDPQTYWGIVPNGLE